MAIIAVIIIAVMTAIVVFAHPKKPAPIPPPVAAPVAKPTPVKTTPAKPVSIQGTLYHTITIATANPTKELNALVGSDNLEMVLEVNRIDAADIVKGRVLIIPNDFSDTAALSPFPATVVSASDIPKLMIVDQAIQAFAIYNNGALAKWGGVNTGKQSTPTPNQLYFANWKGKSVISSEDDSWVLPWYVNLDNTRGISMHQYQLPGYPASHACVRMLNDDAEWIYNWINQWKVSDDGQTVTAYGTPVIVFGQYAFGKTAPWKNLAKDPNATTVSPDTLETTISSYKDTIMARATALPV